MSVGAMLHVFANVSFVMYVVLWQLLSYDFVLDSRSSVCLYFYVFLTQMFAKLETIVGQNDFVICQGKIHVFNFFKLYLIIFIYMFML